ncbi:alpha-(1,6)-fucosyltransferase-like [Daphnia carinata]|uniref:alpha-(1,6)-fucosyltransferase-like n=1 Tax=Daphnia carinata TaxID=120202 RepID=UPI00257C553B|nr:alpha-(1,6)-fucosyltransferase-like [Daphnia carinata]
MQGESVQFNCSEFKLHRATQSDIKIAMNLRSSNKILVQAAIILFFFWVVALILLTRPLLNSPQSDLSDDVLQRLSRAVNELESLKVRNQELQWILTNFSHEAQSGKIKEDVVERLRSTLENKIRVPISFGGLEKKLIDGPSKEYEVRRREIYRGVQEVWYFVQQEMEKLKKRGHDQSAPELANLIQEIVTSGKEHEIVLLNDLQELSSMEGHDSWRAAESRALSDLVQRRLHYLQNPVDCSKARKLVCNLNKSCGYGCQIHHAAYCFIMAYATKRTLILNSKKWRYHRGGWEKVFLPLSDTCTDPSGLDRSNWPGTNDTQVIELPIVDMLSPRPAFLPLAIPRDLSDRMIRLHGDPQVWWIGQFMKYLLRYQPETQKMLDQAKEKMNFKMPVVGVHVRRTDKVGTEAAFHSIDEYMLFVADFFNKLEMKDKVAVRRVYLASDDPSVIPEAKKKYPDYEFLGDVSIAKGAAVATRYTDSSLRGILIDIHMLAHSDHLVCTFSSQVCRLAYEIMQTLHPDASSKFKSLDDIYYYGGQGPHQQIAIYSHKAHRTGEISMEIGDVLGIAGNHWDGYSKGINERTKQSGLYPSFKAVDKYNIVDFPVYSEVAVAA